MDAKATQVLFHAKTQKFVIVLDERDLLKLKNKGTLIRLIKEKIKDVELASGIRGDFDEDWDEMPDLPPHLRRHNA